MLAKFIYMGGAVSRDFFPYRCYHQISM